MMTPRARCGRCAATASTTLPGEGVAVEDRGRAAKNSNADDGPISSAKFSSRYSPGGCERRHDRPGPGSRIADPRNGGKPPRTAGGGRPAVRHDRRHTARGSVESGGDFQPTRGQIAAGNMCVLPWCERGVRSQADRSTRHIALLLFRCCVMKPILK